MQASPASEHQAGDASRPRVLAPPLPPGGTIGVFAPASPYQNRSDVLRGVAWRERHGYRVKLAGGIEDYPDAGGGTTMSETSGTGPSEEIISRATS